VFRRIIFLVKSVKCLVQKLIIVPMVLLENYWSIDSCYA